MIKTYIPKLVENTDDQYKLYAGNYGTMLCGDQLDEKFVKLESVLAALDCCEGDMDLFAFKVLGSEWRVRSKKESPK
jgi:hypothetical protein